MANIHHFWENAILAIVKSYFIYTMIGVIKKKIAGVAEDMKILESSYTTFGNANFIILLGNQSTCSPTELSFDIAMLLLDIHSREAKAFSYTRTGI